MHTFPYVALNAKGVKQKGLIEAESVKHARTLLREQGLIALKVELPRKIIEFKTKTFGKAGMRAKELALITRQLATLLAAGLPVEEVLVAISEQTEKPRSKALMSAVRSKVLEGHALARALSEFPHAFNSLYCATVAAGEKSGHLALVLQRLADYTEQQLQMRQKIQQALIYPMVMIFVAIGIVGFLLEYIVPKMVAVYQDTNQALPGMTQFLISFSEGLKHYGIYILLFCIISVFGYRRVLQKNLHLRKKMHILYLKIPLIGHLLKTANTARFSRTFAILSSAGVSVLEAMHIASKLITNLAVRDAVVIATQRVREGAAIHLALKQTIYFTPMSIHLIASGEASGQLETMLERAAINQDSEVTRFIETSLTLFEPAIILVMGAIVLFIVLAILLPIFQLDQLGL